ncbi:MAG: MBL fold metallo-hydrolase [Bacteroidales bacterium]
MKTLHYGLIVCIFSFLCAIIFVFPSKYTIKKNKMITVDKIIFNPFQVNTYIVYDETKECVIVDAACYDQEEKNALINYIKKHDLKPVALVNTHCHIDHILGNSFAAESFNIPLQAHADGQSFIDNAPQYGMSFGFDIKDPVDIKKTLKEGDKIEFGSSYLEVIEAPGHANGSICLLNKENNILITGDVLFKESIGRTDLPTGDLDLLLKNIKEKLFTLEESTVVYPGHGPETSIGHEKVQNPFILK